MASDMKACFPSDTRQTKVNQEVEKLRKHYSHLLYSFLWILDMPRVCLGSNNSDVGSFKTLICSISRSSTSLTSSQSHSLTILLKLGDQSIALLDHVGVLLVLIVRSIGLDDAIDTINRARYSVSCDEFGKIPMQLARARDGLDPTYQENPPRLQNRWPYS